MGKEYIPPWAEERADINGRNERGYNNEKPNNWWHQGTNTVQNMSANVVYNITNTGSSLLAGCTPHKTGPSRNGNNQKEHYYSRSGN